jgi:hypothetical protein
MALKYSPLLSTDIYSNTEKGFSLCKVFFSKRKLQENDTRPFGRICDVIILPFLPSFNKHKNSPNWRCSCSASEKMTSLVCSKDE